MRRGSIERRRSLEPLLGAINAITGEEKKGVGVFGLCAVGFFWVSGGSYGNEALALSAPPGLLFFGITVVGLSYGIPLALITAELGSGWPLPGGMAQWIEIACGSKVGAHNAWWIFVSFVFDSAIYPVMASEYLGKLIGPSLTWTEKKIYATGIVFVMTLVKLMGRAALERVSAGLALMTLTPSFIYIFWSLHALDPAFLLSTSDAAFPFPVELGVNDTVLMSCPGLNETLCNLVDPMDSSRTVYGGCTWHDTGGCNDIDWALLTSFVMWLYCGFMSLGSMAGELEDPKRSYLISIALLTPVVLIINCFPLMVSLSLDHNRNHFTPGHFQELATKEVGPWMKYVYFLGSQVSLYGLYNSTAIAAECTIPPYFEKYFAKLGFAPDEDGNFKSKLHELFLKGDTDNEEPAPFYVLLNAVVCMGLVWLEYQLLVEVTMLLMVLITYMFLYAFLYLKVKATATHRPFEVPGGLCGALIFTLPPFTISAWYVYCCVFLTVDMSFGIPYFNVLCLVATVAVGLIVHVVYASCCHHCRESPYKKRPPVSSSSVEGGRYHSPVRSERRDSRDSMVTF